MEGADRFMLYGLLLILLAILLGLGITFVAG